VVIANAPAYTIANTTLTDNTSALALAATGVNLGTVNLNGGPLAYSTLNGTATVATLGASQGSILMNADLGSLQPGINPGGSIANYLTITNASNAPTQSVFINTANTQPSAENTSIEMINLLGTGTTNFVLSNPGGKLEYDLTAFELVKGDGSSYTPDPNKWYLSDRALSHAGDAIIQTVGTMPLDWAYSNDSLYLRMGEVRDENLRPAGGAAAPTVNREPETVNSGGSAAAAAGNLWLRTRAYRLNVASEVTGLPYYQYSYGVTAGLDKNFQTGNGAGATLLGLFIDAGRIDRTFDNAGSGTTNTIGIGAYLTLLRDKGWFADLVARADRYSNGFDAHSYDNSITHGDYSTTSYGLSLEAGKRLSRRDGWWVEPTLQASVLWMGSSSFDTRATATQRSMHVTIGSAMSAQYRALVRFGKQFQNSRWSPYGKFAGVAVDTQSADITAHGLSLGAANSGKRVEFGAGTTYRINDNSQIYFDYEYDRAPQYERPWALNLGYRHTW
jgi:outer membrane autotransporter protein